MKKGISILIIFGLFIVGCANPQSPEMVCNEPYIAHENGCCLDKNANDICDEDEEEDVFFVTPEYMDSPVQDIPDTVFEEPKYEEPETVKIIDVPEQQEEELVNSAYTASEPQLLGWSAENEFMSIEVTKIILEINDIKKIDRNAPDKEVILKEIHLKIKNKKYNYLNTDFLFRVLDDRDPLIIKDRMLCDLSDDIFMEGCDNALPEGESMDIRMQIDTKMPRIELEKTFRLVLENRRDTKTANIIEIKKTYDILKISGAKYI